MTSLEDLQAEIREKADRIQYHDDLPLKSDLLTWLLTWEKTLDAVIDTLHEECPSEDQITELETERDRMEDERDIAIDRVAQLEEDNAALSVKILDMSGPNADEGVPV